MSPSTCVMMRTRKNLASYRPIKPVILKTPSRVSKREVEELTEQPIKAILAQGYKLPDVDEEDEPNSDVKNLISTLQLMQCPVRSCGARLGNFPLWKLHIEQCHNKVNKFSCFCGQSQKVSREKFLAHVVCRHGAEAYDELFVGKKAKKRTTTPSNFIRYECLVCKVKLESMTAVRYHVLLTSKFAGPDCQIAKDMRVDIMPGEFLREGYDFRDYKKRCCISPEEKEDEIEIKEEKSEIASPASNKQAEMDYQFVEPESPRGNPLVIAEEPVSANAANQQGPGQSNALPACTSSAATSAFTGMNYTNSWAYNHASGHQFYPRLGQDNIYGHNSDTLGQNYYQGQSLPPFNTAFTPSP